MPEIIKFNTFIDSLDYLLGVNYLFIPSEIVQKMGGLKSGRWICNLENKLSFQCGLVSLTEGNAYITLNKSRMNKLKVKKGDEVSVSLSKDLSKYGMDLSPELEELFDQDKEASFRFDELKPGMQRYIIFYVSQVKNTDLRIERALLLINNLKKIPKGKETFRAILGKE